MPSEPDRYIHQALRTRLVFGPGVLAEAGRELAALGCRRPLLLTSSRARAMPAYAALRAALAGADCAESGDVPAHSSPETVQAAARELAAHGADCLVAFGGGSVADTAKAAALLAAEGGELAAHASRFTPPATVHMPPLLRPKLPILAVPLTASGAEATPSFGIRTDAGEKLLFWDAQLASRVVLLDPQLNAAMPAAVMLETGMNALAHCIEGLYSRQGSPIATALALDGARRLRGALRRVAASPGDVHARGELLGAAHVAGMVLASARSCLHHALCHVLGASSGAAHGALNAVMLPHALRYNLPAAREPLAALAAAWSAGAQAEAAIGQVAALQAELRVPRRLRDLGIARGLLPQVARRALRERGLACNPRQVGGADELEALLDAAW
ncbi:iron-containing alcohol dehydrogenase family protein [Bordetella petrii]|uniref:iron-containing alcohol dehydrogenase family protein n=1 Tax=Bordetella petrii TaxID=94624 RepID=UPI001A97CF10|nr:iron-containing alcohol dehydrogenase [Bordetella petrii]MBO1110363.1 iron-containing alcohol dehydrogenase [Bordetella petrii]